MSDRTKIEWTDATWNPVRGCQKVSEGCRNCYAARVAARFSSEGMPYEGLAEMTPHGPRWTGAIRLVPEALDQPLRWKKPRRVFVNSMSDLFHPADVPDDFIDKIFAVMALCPQHTFQILTKRPERMCDYILNLPKRAANTPALPNRHVPYEDGRICEFLRAALGPGTPLIDQKWPLSNVWLGVSVENQRAADERIPLLLQTPAAVRFLSCEPLLGPVDLSNYLPYQYQATDEWGAFTDVYDQPGVDWVIVGGESGPGARPMHPDWVRSIRDQCQEARVPFFFKQWGGWVPFDQYDGDLTPQMVQKLKIIAGRKTEFMCKVGKKAAGRMLDGRTWDEFPRG